MQTPPFRLARAANPLRSDGMADIRRLVALEADNAGLRDKIELQQGRLQELVTQRDAAIGQLADQAIKLSALAGRPSPTGQTELEVEVRKLRRMLAESDRRLALHTSRREEAEQRALREREGAEALRRSRDEVYAHLKTIQAECNALEQAALNLSNPGDMPTRRAGLLWAQGRRIVYVGGRPGSNAALKALVVAAGGELVVHDGGIEDRKGLLAAALPGADLVLFPVDCIDHDSMHLLKRICERQQLAYHPLRTASVASFLELMSRLQMADDASAGTSPPSRFCLRHG